MSLGLYLAAEDAPSDWLAHAIAWLEKHTDGIVSEGEDDEGRAVLSVTLHPAAEPVELIDSGDGNLIVSASTSAAGPGYHEWLCGELDQLGTALGLRWRRDDDDFADETGFFETRDRAELERHFLAWLRTVAGKVAEMLADGGSVQVCRALDAPLAEVDGAATPMGPRDAAWMRAAAADPARGRDMFPWWESGTGAAFRHGRAVYRIWNEIRWREPLDEDEQILLEDTHEDLAEVLRTEPQRIDVWPEWHELIALLPDCDEALAAEVARRAEAAPERALAGYLRGDVRVRPRQAWTLVIPGALKPEDDDDGTWAAYDESRSVRLTAFTTSDPDAMHELDPTPPGADAWDRFEDDLKGRLIVTRSDDDYWCATGEVVAPGHVAAFTLTWQDDADRDWARATFHSLSFVGKRR